MKKIKDVNSDTLLLGTTKLREVKGSVDEDEPWEARFSDIRAASKEEGIRLWPVNGPKTEKECRTFVTRAFGLQYDGTYQIGCRTFTKKTFDMIIRAAGASK